MRTTSSTLLVLALIAAPAGHAAAQEKAQDYPAGRSLSSSRSRRAAAPTSSARMVGQKLTERFGKSFVIENRPGAGT